MPETNTELEDFKKLVVKKAMAEATKYNWCEVVQKTLIDMGLVDFLPNIFVVQRKDKNERWYDDEFVSTEKKAISEAKRTRRYFVADAKKSHLRTYSAQNQSVYVEVGSDYPLQSALDKVTSAHNRLIDAVKNAPKFVEPEYPKFRAVEKSATGKLLRVLAVAD